MNCLPETPTHMDRVEAILAAPAGRRLLAEIGGVQFSKLLDALELPYPSNISRLDSASRQQRRRRQRTVFGQRVVIDPLHRSERARKKVASEHRRAVSNARSDEIAQAVRRITVNRDGPQRAEVEDSATVLEVFARMIWGFGFWGHEKEYHHLLGAAIDELRPIAQALVSSPTSGWWWDDLPRDDQRCAMRATDHKGGLPRGDEVANRLARAVEKLRTEEVDARSRHPSTSAVPMNASGSWWSIPVQAVWTSRQVPTVPAFHLACAEETSDERVVVWSLRISRAARVLEVREPADWGQLVEMAPLDVTMSRLGDWRRWTSEEGPFYLPDWSVIAEHFDGVHVTVGGYLTTRSVPVPVADGCSILAGWNPDATLWLRDVTEAAERVGEFGGPFEFSTRETN